MRTNKRATALALRCILFLAALVCVVSMLDRALKLRHRDGMSAEYYRFPKGTFDVVFLGSSMMMYGVLPLELYDEYGIASYNLSTGNQDLGISYYLIKEVIEKDHPSLIVLDCSRAVTGEEDTSSTHIHYVTDSMPYFSRNRIEMILSLGKKGERKELLFPLIAYHSRWDGLERLDGNVVSKEGMYGSRLMAGINKADPFEEPEYVEDAVTESSRDYLEKIISLCRETDTGLQLVSLPVPGQNEFFGQEGYDLRWSATKQLETFAQEQDVPYISYMEREREIGLDPDTDFFDGEHMNRWGAAKFSKLFGEYIQETYGIPDRRNDGGIYDRIAEDAKKYPVYRMQASLQNANAMRRISDTLADDMKTEPVRDAVVLFALNGQIDPEKLGEESGLRLQKCGITRNLHDWTGHSWIAVLDGGEVVYETSPRDESADAPDTTEGTTGVLNYSVSSGSRDEETGEVKSGASIRINGLEYTMEKEGLYMAAFDKTNGRLLDACRIDLRSDHLALEHISQEGGMETD